MRICCVAAMTTGARQEAHRQSFGVVRTIGVDVVSGTTRVAVEGPSLVGEEKTNCAGPAGLYCRIYKLLCFA